jgi:DnaJ-domain-containing protein 1
MTDHTLKKLFNEARRQDASNMPDFQRVLRKQAVEHKDSPAFGWLPFALAVALLVAAALLAFSVLPKNETHTAAEIEQWAAISDWTASSDAILAENTPCIGVPLSTSSDLLFESTPISSDTSKNQNL